MGRNVTSCVIVLEPVNVGDVTSRRQLLRDIEIFHVYHSHQYIVIFISVVVQLLHFQISEDGHISRILNEKSSR